MTGENDRLVECVSQIVEAIDKIERYIVGLDAVSFAASTLVQDAVVRNLEIIGEAAGRIQKADRAFAERCPHLRLDLAYRMRNALIHGYDAVNLDVVWNTVQRDLPQLRKGLAAIDLRLS